MTQNVSEISVFVGNNVFGKKSITETLCGLFHFFLSPLYLSLSYPPPVSQLMSS